MEGANGYPQVNLNEDCRPHESQRALSTSLSGPAGVIEVLSEQKLAGGFWD